MVCMVKDMFCFVLFFPVVMYKCKSWTIKKGKHQKVDAFKLWCWRRFLRVPWTARRSKQSILKEINTDIHWKNWPWSWRSNTFTTRCEELAHWKNPYAGKDWGQEEKGTSEDEMVGWHHWLNGRVWANFRIWWRTGKHGVLQPMGSQRIGYDLASERQVIGNKITSNPQLSSMCTMEVD